MNRTLWKISLLRKNDKRYKNLLKSQNKVEIAKIQDKFINSLEKSGYSYNDSYTFKEYTDMMGKNNLDVKNDLNALTDKIYFARYSSSKCFL